MAVLVTQEVVRATNAAARTVFDTAFAAQEGAWKQIATLLQSTGATEEYNWIGQVPVMREWLDERQITALSAYGYTIRNKKFEATIAVAREVLEDEAHAQIRTRVESLAEAASAHYDALVFDLVKEGETQRAYDGAAFYGTHMVGGVSRTNLGTGVLSATSLENAIATMMRTPLDNGEPMLIRPTHLLVPPELQFEAMRLVASAFNPGATGAANAANPLQGFLTVVTTPRLTSSTEWHLLDCSRSVKPFFVQQRIAPEFSALDGETGEPSETAFLRDELWYGVRSRDNAGYGLWQMAYKSTGEGE
ncbi:MAG: Mu-like prophage major head subunit gpT family protein [Armatimonadetes bacterium]|nr:Mu-like prophage major head subunit gpT family protein [Armatimonadota bacterium]